MRKIKDEEIWASIGQGNNIDRCVVTEALNPNSKSPQQIFTTL